MKFKNLIPFFCVAVAGLGVGLYATENYLNRKIPRLVEKTPANPTLAPLWDAPAFALTDQEGRQVTDRDLRGHVWVCDFIFTQCAASCPVMSQKMARLQAKIGDPSVKLVSFSVDPDHDTPAALKTYGERYGADFSRWSFLSSPGRSTIWAVAKGMRMTGEQTDAQDQILHNSHFVLTDGQGRVRGIYNSEDDNSMRQLLADVLKLGGNASAAP